MRHTTGTIVTRTVRGVPRLGLYLADDGSLAEVVTIDGKVKRWALNSVTEHDVQDVGQFSRIAMRVLIRQAQELETVSAVATTVDAAVAKRKALIEKGAARAISDSGYADAVIKVLRRSGLSVPPRPISRTVILDLTTRGGTSTYMSRVFPPLTMSDYIDCARTLSGLCDMPLATVGTGCVCSEPVTREQIDNWYRNTVSGPVITEVRSVLSAYCTGGEGNAYCYGGNDLPSMRQRLTLGSAWRAEHTMLPDGDGTFATATLASQIPAVT